MTTRAITAAMQAHLDTFSTTLIWILKITARNGSSFGVSQLDIDVFYDDGNGEVRYQSAIGLDQSSIESSANLDVDNSQATMLLVDPGDFTDEAIAAGVLDFADFELLRVNWEDLTYHYRGPFGTLGAVSSKDGLAGVVELRGKAQSLKQTFVDLYSLTCRARFGSGYADEKFPCLFDAESLWSADTVLSVSSEPDRVFTATTTPSATGPNGALNFVPGLVRFTSGSNDGASREIENVQGDEITLRFPTAYPIAPTDDYDIRPDCNKLKRTCIDDYDNFENMRAEPELRPADEASSGMPGANYPRYPGFGYLEPEEGPAP